MATKASADGEQAKPNVVFILADNVGWGDIGCYSGTAPTPRIDALASQGLRFKNYNIEAQCTPTRSAILTGRLPVRTGCYSIPLPGQGEYGLAPWEYTMGELFSDAGYATALYGKWHVGEDHGRLPIDQGFDEWFGIKNTSDECGYTSYPLFAQSGFPIPKTWEGVKGSEARPVGDLNLETRPFLDEQITGRTVEFIKRNAEAKKPFFVYVGLTQMHPPLLHHPDFKGKSGGGTYSDTLAELDYRTGQILDALEEAGIADDTIVLWNSDNAAIGLPATGGSNGPWRGAFASGFEGGMRVPAIVRWPGKIPAGTATNEIFAAVDWLPTLAHMAGESGRVPTDRPIDGIDSSELLLGRSDSSNRDHVLFYGSDGELLSVKWKTMKVVFRYAETTTGPFIRPQVPMVFDLIEDPKEESDLVIMRMDCAWVIAPTVQRIGSFMKSTAKYPNIKPGEEFEGYK
jgi:arylsulfatase A-like enzyme